MLHNILIFYIGSTQNYNIINFIIKLNTTDFTRKKYNFVPVNIRFCIILTTPFL